MAKKKKVEIPERKVVWHIQDDGSVSPIIQNQKQDIAPVKQNNNTWLKKGTLDDSGYAIQNPIDAINRINAGILMTGVDALGQFGKGFLGSAEGVSDIAKTTTADVLDFFGADNKAKKLRKSAEKTWGVNEQLEQVLASDNGTGIDDMSFLGEKGKTVPQGLGTTMFSMTAGSLLGGPGGMALLGLSAAGNAEQEAIKEMKAYQDVNGFSDKEIYKNAKLYGVLSGTAEALTEMMFGAAAKGSKLLGIGTGVFDEADDAVIHALTKRIQNNLVKTFTQAGLKATSEGFEEVASGLLDAFAKKITYQKDKKYWDELVKDENLLDSFLSGTFSAALSQSPSVARNVTTVEDGKIRLKNNNEIRDFITDLNQQEQQVVEREIENRIGQEEKVSRKRRTEIEKQVIEDLDRGYINANTIRETLGDNYNPERDIRLNESFNEEARRSQAFETDLSQYEGKQKEIVQDAIESGLLNNTNKTHDMVDWVSKICADKGLDFGFTNNENIKNTGFAIDGKQVNGFIQDGKIMLNLESNQALNKTVGHEITHVLEGTDLYNSLQDSLKSFIGEREWNNRISELEKTYKGVKGANIENELTSDLVGEYVFNDESFVRSLSTRNPNLFQKIFDEIKYMVKIATAGSKEARDLEKVKRAFEKAYRETSKTQEGTQYAIKSTQDGTKYVESNNLKLEGELTEKNVYDILKGTEYTFEDGDSAYIVGWLKSNNKDVKSKNMYNELFKRYPKYFNNIEDVKDFNTLVNYNTDELLKTSKKTQSEIEDINQRHKDWNIESFDTRQSILYDNKNDKAYIIDFSIANMENGDKIAYAKKYAEANDEILGKIKADNRVETTRLSASDDNISQNNDNVKYSITQDSNDNEVDNYIQEKGYTFQKNGNLEVNNLTDKQIKDLVKLYHTTGYEDVSADYLTERLKSGQMPIQREVADRFIEKELGHKPQYDTTQIFEDAEGNPLTTEQVEFYKDSGVRDIRGRLIPVYHKTNADFTIFDDKVGTQHGKKYGKGFYFSITPENYGNNTMKVYLNAKDGEFKYVPKMGYYIVQEANQIKNVDNKAPTSNPDIRYSLSDNGEMVDNSTGEKVTLEASEEGNSGTLMVLHNLGEDKFNGVLDLGGIPVPSIAVTNPNIIDHNQFGEGTLIFDKSTIDPAIEANEVYDRDVWSPTIKDNVQIDYEINDDAIETTAEKLGIEAWRLRDAVEDNKPEYLAERLLREEKLIDKYVKDNNIKYETAYKDAETKVDMHQSGENLRKFIRDNDLTVEKISKDRELRQKYFDEIKKYYDESSFPQAVKENLYKEKMEYFDKWIDERTDIRSRDDIPRGLLRYQDDFDLIKSGDNKVIDEWQTEKNKKQAAIDNGIEEYLKQQTKDVYGEKGIRNDVELFTNSGNRRSFWALHDEYNLDNLVEALTKGETTGTQHWGSGYGQIQATMANRFNSISDIKANEGLLTNLSENNEALENAKASIDSDIEEIEANNDVYYDTVAELLVDFARGDLTIDNFRELTRNDYQTIRNVSDSLIEKIIDDMNSLKNLPTDYFEAKPQRAVGLDEIQMAVIPNNWSTETKQRLTDMGIQYTEYDPSIEGDRQRVINQFDSLKFSLSQDNIAPTSGWNVRSEDVRLQSAFQDTIAPLQEQVQELSNSINELKENIPKYKAENIQDEETDFSDVNIDKDIQDMTIDDIDASPFLEGLQGARERQAERQQQREEINQKKEVKIPKQSNGRRAVNRGLGLLVNEFAVLDDYSKQTKNKDIKFKTDTYNNYQAIAQSNIETAQTDINGKRIGRSGNSIFEEAKRYGLADTFDEYLKQWANVDRAKQGKGAANFSAKESYKIVKEMEAKNPRLKKLGADMWQYYRNARHNLRDAGIISQEVSDMLGRMYPHYTPYISENIENYFVKDGELKPKSTIKRAKGGAAIGSLLSAEEAMQRYTKSEFNTIFGNDLFKEIVNTSNDIVQLGGDDRGMQFVNADNLYADKNGYYLTAYENGNPITTKISEDMYRTLTRESRNRISDIENTFSAVTKPLQAASNIRRNILTSWSPTFMAKNFIKDFQEGIFNSKYTKDFIKNYPSAFKELATNTELAQQFKSLYGSGLTMGQYDIDANNYNPSGKNRNFLKGIKNVNELIELAPRYAEFKASIDHGASIQEAMYNAREVTTNFSRGGTLAKALNRNGFTFLNSSIQGFDKFIRNFSGENGAKGIVNSLAKAVIFGIAPAVFNELAFGSGDDKDEEYEALPDYIKDNYYIIKVGNGQFIRIPKGRVFSVFGSAARRTIEAMEGEENAFEGYWNNVQQQIGINNPEENNIFAPLIQAMGGRKLDSGQTAGEAWYGGDIIPSRLQKERPEDQYDVSIDKFSIWLGQRTGISPYKINYVLDQYTGGIGDIGLPMITDEANSDGSIIAPIKDQFTADTITDNKYVSEFYDTKNKLYTGSKATDEDMLKSKYMNDISKQMGELYAERREIQADTTLTKKEKYEKAQAIKSEINRLAKEGLDNYEKVGITGDYADTNGQEYQKTEDGWRKLNENTSDELNLLGLTSREKNNYIKTKQNISSIKEKYKDSDDYNGKKNEIIGEIINTNLDDNSKLSLYQDTYRDKLADSIDDLGINADTYLEYKAQDFSADKDKNGKSISGSKKRKVFDYINSLDIPYQQKLILAKSEYNSFNDNNYEIIEYIENSGMDYSERIELYKNLGFKVDGDNISW